MTGLKTVIGACVLVAVCAQNPDPQNFPGQGAPTDLPPVDPQLMYQDYRNVTKYQVRELPADVLRDFPGHCFASTACRVFAPGVEWRLEPFCGVATCAVVPTGGPFVQFLEVVATCRTPKNGTDCTVGKPEEADVIKGFPHCCPVVTCTGDVEPEYFTDEELAGQGQGQGQGQGVGPQGQGQVEQGPPGQQGQAGETTA